MNGPGLGTGMSLPIKTLVANVIHLIRAEKEVGALLLAIKRGAVSEDTQQAPTPDPQRLQSEARLAQAGLIIRNGSDSWVLTDLGQQVWIYLSQHEADEELAQMYGRLEFTADSVFLDLGCGAGPALVKACELPTSPRFLVGIDIDRSSLMAANAFLGMHRRRCLLVQADLAALPIKTEAVSHLCSRLSLPYVDQHASMAELGRVLKPGGNAFLQLHAPGFYVQLLYDELSSWKRIVCNSFCLFNGFLFSLLGIQLRIPRPRGVYQELYQTHSGMRRVLKRHGIAVLWSESDRLFRIFGRKQRT
jgi:ubiquinone/menaquinone biosynthesis C-methylase UbiE